MCNVKRSSTGSSQTVDHLGTELEFSQPDSPEHRGIVIGLIKNLPTCEEPVKGIESEAQGAMRGCLVLGPKGRQGIGLVRITDR